MIFFAVAHDHKRGSVYLGGEFQITHRRFGPDQCRVRVERRGKDLGTFSGTKALARAMEFCGQHQERAQ